MQRFTLSASDMAALLVDEMIDNQHIHAHHLKMDEDTSGKFKDKARLYQVAAVLMAIMSAEQQNKELKRVKDEFENLIFSLNPTPASVYFVSKIRDAMMDLQSLLYPKNPGASMSWARAWLHGVNIDESNPASLGIFSMQYIDFYICVRKALANAELSNV
ncbi:hypothetical protein [Metallibacterium scheffleri]